MKQDGHNKLSVEAVTLLKGSCSVDKELCALQMANTGGWAWHNRENSNVFDST